MPFLMILLVIIAIMAAVGVFSLVIGSLLLLLKFALPLIVIGLIVSFIYRAIVGPSRRPRHADWRHDYQDYSYQETAHQGSRQRKEARDVKVDDDDWSDF
ncbi:hypothetical protein EFM09_08220 [Latilactobacillus curvatus]|uniref:Uncharacterized protein n=1 Tax=Latilactobacillus curvatus TaxID=28038 RepID=A0A385AFD4_LATCU|nr:hypothetical protein [Latilactobacillus curvatus]ASN62484.1 hypothetical protein CGZ47_07980 [Latilactobacillus curvatus]AXN36334.1 hypothetical protein DT351_08125 [Latilactobacillus curvatus]AZP95964.1 hypothetical protein CYK59_02900 [Latilactobacillus curvatus]EHE86292.1 hypothetical protein CRL705_586 [Latilactobacillus curvatus CRL 705]MCP8861356.1 hypothetical protein [Latilactobacillus curvatus]